MGQNTTCFCDNSQKKHSKKQKIYCFGNQQISCIDKLVTQDNAAEQNQSQFYRFKRKDFNGDATGHHFYLTVY